MAQYTRFGGRKLLHSVSVQEVSPTAPPDEVTYRNFDGAGPGTKKQLQRRSCLVIGGHQSAEHQPESYLFSLLKNTLGAPSLLPTDNNGSRSHGDKSDPPPNFPWPSADLSLHDFAKLYHSLLPLTVHMISSPAPDQTPPPQTPPILPSEVVKVHSMADTSVVVCIYKDLQIFHLPLDVDMRFAPLYDPCDDPTLAVAGMVFYGVMSVLHSDPMPKVLCARSRWRHLETVIHVGEVLIVKGTYIKGRQLRGLSVFSMSTRSDKVLPLKCPLQFTTQAKYLFLSLSDIVNHIPEPFPCKACVLGNADGPVSVGNIPHDVITLNEITSASVLTCTVTRGEGQHTCSIPIALPDVRVVVLESSQRGGKGEEEEEKEEEKEEEEVWESWDSSEADRLLACYRAGAVDSFDKQAGTTEQADSQRTRQGHSNVTRVGTEDYEDMDGSPVPDMIRVRETTVTNGIPVLNAVQEEEEEGATIRGSAVAPAQSKRCKDYLKQAVKTSQDYEDMDGPSTIVRGSTLVATRTPRKGPNKHGDADYEDMDVFDDPPAGVASAVWHKKAGDPRIHHTDTSCEYENMDRTPGDLATGEGGGTPPIKPQGWIYMSSSYDAYESTEHNGDRFERCDSAVILDDDYADLVQSNLITATRTKE